MIKLVFSEFLSLLRIFYTYKVIEESDLYYDQFKLAKTLNIFIKSFNLELMKLKKLKF